MSTEQDSLLGAHEIRVRLGGVSRQRAYQITSRRDFPEPVADLAQGKVWRTVDVEKWLGVHRPDQAHSAIQAS
ncbi:helix-turn-helix transcriptional regulator [Winogradskya humida]|uniref:helix-turn-helix transcriptional regulator n=1 Tax=Winogradskya humida TaxID=113566 RepID=UPI0019459C44|nr:DNA-binding protein [Actinoplanes humidus]